MEFCSNCKIHLVVVSLQFSGFIKLNNYFVFEVILELYCFCYMGIWTISYLQKRQYNKILCHKIKQ